MGELLSTLALGVLGGVAVGTQAQLAGSMSARIGGASASFVIHCGGAALSGALALVRGGERLWEWRSLSWPMLGSGAFGVVLYLTLSHTIPRLGATGALTLVVAGQLVGATLIDHFGLLGATVRPVDAARCLGVLAIVGGAYLSVR